MVPSQALIDQIAALLATDADTLAPATNANKVRLVVTPFTPAPGLDIASLTFANFDGGAPIAGETGDQPIHIDPATGEWIITMKEPLGGWAWKVTGVTNLPQTVYGYALTDSAGMTLLGSAVLPTPVGLTAVAQGLDLGEVSFRVNAEPLS